MNIPPSISFNGNKNRAISLKSKAIKFYNYIANQAETLGVGYVSRILPFEDGSSIRVTSYRDNNYGSRFGSISITGSGISSGSVEIGDRIVVFPISDDFPNGWIPLPKASVVYGSDTKRKKLLRHTPTTVDGGNCYWRGTNKDLLTFEGPWGFQVAPAVLNTSEVGYTAWNIEGYTANKIGFDSNGDVTASWPPSFTLATYDRFYTSIWKNGSVIATSTYKILGCGISRGNLVIVVNISLSKDRILVAPIPTSGTITSWTTVGDIDYISVSGLTYLYRSNIYSFSKDGSKIITLVDCYKDKARLSKSITRISLDYDISNNLIITSQSLTLDSEISYDLIVDAHSNSEEDYSHVYSVDGLVGKITIAVGFIGNIENILELKPTVSSISYERFTTVPPPLYPTIYRHITNKTNYTLDFYLNGVKKIGMSIIYNNPSVSINDSVWGPPERPDLTTTISDLQYHLLSTIDLSFLDINNVVFCYTAKDYLLNHYWTYDAYSYEADYHQKYSRTINISLINKTKDKNKTTTDTAIPYTYSTTTIPSGDLFTESSIPIVYIPNTINISGVSSPITEYLNLDPRQRIIQPNNYLRPSYNTGNAYVAGSPICKGVADKFKNFVGNFRYQYISEILTPTPSIVIPFNYLEKNVISLPNNENPTTLFTMTGNNQTIAGSRYRTDDRERKIFIVNLPI